MKKFLKTILFLSVVSSFVYTEELSKTNTGLSAEAQKDAMDTLDRMREKI